MKRKIYNRQGGEYIRHFKALEMFLFAEIQIDPCLRTLQATDRYVQYIFHPFRIYEKIQDTVDEIHCRMKYAMSHLYN